MPLYIFGPFNSGTNILQNLFKEFLQERSHQDVWKHSLDFKKLSLVCQNQDNKIICMYKSIYNWIYSIKKASYDIEFKSEYNIELHGIPFNNIIELYNSYYNTYKLLLNKYNNIIFIDYYKLIDRNGYQYLEQKLLKLKIKIPNLALFNKIMNCPSKNHGNCISNNLEALRIKNLNYITIKNEIEQNKYLYQSLNTELYNYFENDFKD
jgi:hypothetical protein